MTTQKKSLGIAAATGFALALLFIMISGLFGENETSTEFVRAAVLCVSLAVVFLIGFLVTKKA